MTNQTNISETILDQLGANRFCTMVGAKHLMNHGEALSFKHMKCAGKTNYCKITLNDADLYDIEFGYLRGVNYKIVKELSNVYAEDLQRIFNETTGLGTHL